MLSAYSLKKEVFPYVALALVISTLAWSVGFYFAVHKASAAALTDISDTISDSDLGAGALHVIQWTNGSTTNDSETIRITFDPLTDRFDGVQNLILSNVSTTGMTLVAACGGGGDEVTFSTSSAVGDESIIFTVCSGDTVAAGTKTVTVGGVPLLTNPTSTGSYIIRIAGTQSNSGDTRVAILSDVIVTASVSTALTFTVSGVATGTIINGVTSTYGTNATSMSFGTLPVGNPITLGQRLNVYTNAQNGFVVTVVEDQNLLSTTNADIDLFVDGNATTTPSPWVAPANTLGQENTFGHMGLTSDDDLNADEFGTSSTPLFAGNFNPTSSRQIFSHDAPADGLTASIGSTTVAYRIQIGNLQEAATDYMNRLTYVCTPTF